LGRRYHKTHTVISIDGGNEGLNPEFFLGLKGVQKVYGLEVRVPRELVSVSCQV